MFFFPLLFGAHLFLLAADNTWFIKIMNVLVFFVFVFFVFVLCASPQPQDASVCLRNYRVDGAMFWNQFFIAALRDSEGAVINYVGVQCKVQTVHGRFIIIRNVIREIINKFVSLRGTGWLG